MFRIIEKSFRWFILNLISLIRYNRRLFIGNLVVAPLFCIFLYITYYNPNYKGDNDIFWNHIFPVFSFLLTIQITVLTFVLSIYLPPIMKELKDLSVGIDKSVRKNLLRNNAISQNISHMVISIFMMAILMLLLFYLDLKAIDVSKNTLGCAVFILLIWVMVIMDISRIDYDNYVKDCLLLLPINVKNQHSYYTVIYRQLDNHLTKNDVYRFNNDLIEITKFIAQDKFSQFVYCEDFCIKPFFNINNESQYVKSITYTYDNSLQNFSYSKDPISEKGIGLPQENITKFQDFLFSSNSILLKDFLIEVVSKHQSLKKSSQHELIGYYLWVLNNLCITNNDYSFTFAMDIMREFKAMQDARKFLLDAMAIVLHQENVDGVRGLYQGYFYLLKEKGIDYYVKLKNKEGSQAWLFSDLIYLTMTYFALELSTNHIDKKIIYDITMHCFNSGSKDIFLEYLAWIYFYNKITPSKPITRDYFKTTKDSVFQFDNITPEFSELLEQILNNNPLVIQELDARTFIFSRAINNYDFWKNKKIKQTDYRNILRQMLNE